MSLILSHDHPLARELMFRATVERWMREAKMPTEKDALRELWNAQQRLKELGGHDWIYMPKDGTPVLLIESGSTGIHEGFYMGDWPNGSVNIAADGDFWPSHPILFKPVPAKAGA